MRTLVLFPIGDVEKIKVSDFGESIGIPTKRRNLYGRINTLS